MKKIATVIVLLLLNLSCNFEKPTDFTEEVLQVELTDLNNDIIIFENILNKHRGDKIVIDIWASWCRDCIEGMPTLKDLQQRFPDVKYVFISLDRSINGWKNGIQRYGVKGDHYFLNSGWDGPMDDFLNLNWIPRYVVVDEAGKIAVFKAIKASDEDIINVLKQ